MKKYLLIPLSILCLCHLSSFGQKKYEMTIEKKDGTNIVVDVDDIVRTYFKEKVEPVTQKIIDLSPFTVNFGTVSFGSSKTELVVISNVGTADLTFRIQKVDDDFIIDESDMDIVLPAGTEKIIKVVFMPRLADREYAQTAMIYTDADNGNQTLTMYGTSGKAQP